MKITQTSADILNDSLVIVSAKEHGKIYQIRDGEMTLMEYVEERPSDREPNQGFFFLSSGGREVRSGAPHEVDDTQDIRKYIQAISDELRSAIEAFKPKKLYLFEPEHLKGMIKDVLIKQNNLRLITVKYGNYVQSDPADIVKMLEEFKDDGLDPSDPASVADGENADEIRKILKTGQKLDS